MTLENILLVGIVVSLVFSAYCLVRAKLELRRLDRLAHPLDYEGKAVWKGGQRGR